MSSSDLTTYFALWYVGNIAYNEYNKEAAHSADADKTKYAMIISTSQLLVGAVYALIMWGTGAAKKPKLTTADIIKCIPAGVCSAGAHAASVFSLAAGGVAFGQIVKSAEPVFAALVSSIFYGKKQSMGKWMCLIPIIGGVVLASLKLKDPNAPFGNPLTYVQTNIEMDFSVGGLVGALIANLFAAFKGNESHKLMHVELDAAGKPVPNQLKDRFGSPSNQFAVMSIVSLIVSIPLAVFREKDVMGAFTAVATAPGTIPPFIANLTKMAPTTPFLNATALNVLLSGMAFYLYNEAALKSLKFVSPATNSVANTAKRVVVIGWGVVMHGAAFGLLKQLGCTICILGVYMNANIDTWMPPSGKSKTA
jgi:solute carrier family 35 protein E1